MMNYSGISECDVLNGTGFRVVLFVSGCSHKCYNCQNPKTWDKNFGYPFTEKTKQYIFNCLDKDYIDGITITGGDPLYDNNLDEVLYLINEIRISFPEKSIWLYTGYTWEDLINVNCPFDSEWENRIIREDIIELCDVLVDGEYIDEERDLSKKWAGSKNQRVINVRESIKNNKII